MSICNRLAHRSFWKPNAAELLGENLKCYCFSKVGRRLLHISGDSVNHISSSCEACFEIGWRAKFAMGQRRYCAALRGAIQSDLPSPDEIRRFWAESSPKLDSLKVNSKLFWYLTCPLWQSMTEGRPIDCEDFKIWRLRIGDSDSHTGMEVGCTTSAGKRSNVTCLVLSWWNLFIATHFVDLPVSFVYKTKDILPQAQLCIAESWEEIEEFPMRIGQFLNKLL